MLQSDPVGTSIVLIDTEEINESNKKQTLAEIIAHILGIKVLSKYASDALYIISVLLEIWHIGRCLLLLGTLCVVHTISFRS